MLTDNLEYLTDEERGWRDEVIKLSSTRPAFGLLGPRVDLRLHTVLDRLAQTRAQVAAETARTNEERQRGLAAIQALEQEVAHYKKLVENEQHAEANLENCHLYVGPSPKCKQCGLDVTDNIHHKILVDFKECKHQLADEQQRSFQMSAELEMLRQRITQLDRPQHHEPIAPPAKADARPPKSPAQQPETKQEPASENSDRGLHPQRAGTHL